MSQISTIVPSVDPMPAPAPTLDARAQLALLYRQLGVAAVAAALQDIQPGLPPAVAPAARTSRPQANTRAA